MKKVHELDRPTVAQATVVDPLRLVVELQLDRKYLNVLCAWEGQGFSLDHGMAESRERRVRTKVDLSAVGARVSGLRYRCCSWVAEGEEALEEVERVLVDMQTQREDFGL